MAAVAVHDICLCAPVKAELIYGALRSADPAANLVRVGNFARPFPSLPFDDASADHFARNRRDLESRGMMIGPSDLQIGAIALANALTLVTHNTREFSRISGLTIEDWEA